MGAIAILVFATKDTGTIIQPVQIVDTKGAQMTFADGEVVNVVNESATTYTVERDGVVGEVNKEYILLTQRKSVNYSVRRITALKEDPNSENVKRFLLEKETLTVQKNEGAYCFVLTEDNMTGYVLTEDLEKENLPIVNLAFLQADVPTADGGLLPKDTLVVVKSYGNGVFRCLDQSGKEHNIPKEQIRFVNEQITRGLDSRFMQLTDSIIAKAKEFIGTPYVYGSSGPNAFDCSGFTSHVYKLMGYTIPRSSASQSNYGTPIAREDLLPGDLLFFNTTGSGVSHVGIYIGNGQFIHAASSPVNRVTISSLSEAYYSKRYISARRVLK